MQAPTLQIPNKPTATPDDRDWIAVVLRFPFAAEANWTLEIFSRQVIRAGFQRDGVRAEDSGGLAVPVFVALGFLVDNRNAVLLSAQRTVRGLDVMRETVLGYFDRAEGIYRTTHGEIPLNEFFTDEFIAAAQRSLDLHIATCWEQMAAQAAWLKGRTGTATTETQDSNCQ